MAESFFLTYPPENPIFNLFGMPYDIFYIVSMLAFAWPSFATSAKRFHDLNMTAWWNVVFVPVYFWTPDFLNLGIYPVTFLIFFVLVQLAALVLALIQLFRPGITGPNKYGVDPLENT